ncbi:hypothetical protein THASP1DRAFT_30359 [Thamnocephalis sphaerospora]|uniref:Uncharacterized protein n=1 Tax=Thamnocephalis sphaerospora TaxID=78915 RepID=A0A4P9XPA4_9FUNG|nr:hypothetical protein THASP1DRAFT_30359 [Thamnocephalis sphaerospora]|eukprot:RKP07825.1 hypothetical protein THASP1DRAFT_30359 [Thamnocephalis sphaerospora]
MFGLPGVGDDEAVLGKNWKDNATYVLGFPIHYLGTLNSYEYVMQAEGDPAELRQRFHSAYLQAFLAMVMTCVFLRNAAFAAVMVYRRPRLLAGWCCLIQPILGLVFSIGTSALIFPGALPCYQVIFATAIGVSVSPICIGAVLLQKAYIVHDRNKWLLATGIIMIILQSLVVFIAMDSPILMVPDGNCTYHYPRYLPWTKLAFDLPANVVFSAAFLVVVYRQYRIFGSAVWGRLVRNGIQNMCLIVFSNFICIFCAAFEVGGAFAQTFITVDWTIASTLLVHHCQGIRNTTASSEERGPRTVNAIDGFSQIRTAASVLQNTSTDLEPNQWESHETEIRALARRIPDTQHAQS